MKHVGYIKGRCQKKSFSPFRSDTQGDEAHFIRIPDQP
jgi:hypothetical protein